MGWWTSCNVTQRVGKDSERRHEAAYDADAAEEPKREPGVSSEEVDDVLEGMAEPLTAHSRR